MLLPEKVERNGSGVTGAREVFQAWMSQAWAANGGADGPASPSIWSSGREALQIARKKQFDVVLSDISMPEMDGFEFLSKLRKIPGKQDVPAVALTGFGRPEDVQRACNEGFYAHLTKPFDIQTLASILQKMPRQTATKRVSHG